MTPDDVTARELFDLYTFPVSRQLYALNQVADALGDCDDALLCGWVADAIRLAEEAFELEAAFSRRRRKREFGPGAREADRDMDRALGALARVLSASAQAFGEASVEAALARHAASRLFPEGVRAMIHLPFVEEEVQVRMLLRRVEAEPRLRQALRELGADPFVQRVAAVHARYQEALRRDREQPTYAQVKQARCAGQERLCQIAALILVRLATGEGGAALKLALGAITHQNAAIGRSFKRRARATEVDPETGEDLEAEDQDPRAASDLQSSAGGSTPAPPDRRAHLRAQLACAQPTPPAAPWRPSSPPGPSGSARPPPE